MAKPTSTGSSKSRLRLAAVIVAVAVGVVAALAGAAYASVGTDQSDYLPGSVVTISGGNDSTGLPGYTQGHTVNVDATADNGLWEQTCSDTVAADGTWSCQVTLSNDPAVAVGTYSYTATSTVADGSPISESGTFTDSSAVRTMTYTKAGSGSGTVTFKSGGPDNPNTATGNCSVSGDTATCTGSGTFNYNNNEFYTITASAAAGSSFASWSAMTTVSCGATTNPCTDTIAGNDAAITATFNLVPVGPTVEAGGPYSGNEGSPISLSGASVTPVGAGAAYSWTINYNSNMDSGGSCSFSPSNAVLNPSVTCTDDSNAGYFTLTLSYTDTAHTTAITDTAQLTVSNVAPTTSNEQFSFNSYTGVGTASFDYADAGTNDTHTGSFAWSDATLGTLRSVSDISDPSETGGAGTMTDHYTFAPGCYSVTVTGSATDDDGGVSDTQTMADAQAVDIYSVAFLPPIMDNVRNVAKYGNVVPVKVQILDGCTGLPVTDASLFIRTVEGNVGGTDGGTEAVTQSVSSADSGTQMRLADGFYIYNFATKQLRSGIDYTIQIRLGSTTGPVLITAVLGTKK